MSAIDAYELEVVGRKRSSLRVLRELLFSLAAATSYGSVAAYNIRVRDRRSQEVLGLIDAGDDPGTAAGLLELMVARAHEMTPREFLAYYHLGDEP